MFGTLWKYLVHQFRQGYDSSITAHSVRDLQDLDPAEFESKTAEIWNAKGYSVKITKQSRDNGIDVIAEKNNKVVAVQAKCYASENKVSSSTVQQIVGSAQQIGADEAAIVTSSTFTQPAKEAGEALGVQLINGERAYQHLTK